MIRQIHPLRVTRLLVHYALKFAGTIVLSILFKNFVLELYVVRSSSMEPTLLDGDYVLVAKYAYRIRTPETLPFTNIPLPSHSWNALKPVRRGDVAVFKPPIFVNGERAWLPEYLVKRCIGIPGDTLDSITVPRRGYTVPLQKHTKTAMFDVIRNEGHSLTLSSNDLVQLDGRAAASYIVEKDYYYMMGDNALHSFDSRNYGFVPEENFIGEAVLVLWSLAPGEVSWYRRIRWNRLGRIIS